MGKSTVRKILIWTLSILVVIVTLGYFAMDYGVNYALRSMIASNPTHVVLDEPKDAKSGERDQAEQAKTGHNGESALSENSPQTTGWTAPTNNNAQDKTGNEPVVGVPSDSAEQKYTGEITPEKIRQAEETITLKEKTRVTTILLRKLSSSDIRNLMGMSSMSIEEKRKTKKMFLEKVSEEEYDELIVIAAKLGLSQGKSYAESLKGYDW